ncbi:toxin secretion/phage lysis holin [Pseudobutyrivibrio sp. UC1225]|uniref:phage holin family protein n=1 Tax=Pseudobutyrivibrio sp. UC1225 TaxID=1798185 RepID=UPI0008DF06F8|nr:phage holin family protein [Pseudobutyrivibrio sp. UC1225]SFO03732.1 toxin secretion/phage lysis holin [Pseudobutyrivibrio sp. UC1225]
MMFDKIIEEIQLEAGIISGLIGPAFSMLLVLMFTDYISGILAARTEAIKRPNDKKSGLNSRKGVIGIYKKIGYVITIFVSICLDYLIGKYIRNLGVNYNDDSVLGLMVTLWFDINEIISIFENMGRMGVTLPKKIRNILVDLKSNMDDE